MNKFEISTALTLLLAIIGGAAYLVRSEGRVAALDAIESQINTVKAEALQEISASKGAAITAVQQALAQSPGTMFGTWVPIPVNRALQAESDGFVSAYTHSHKAATLSLRIGKSESDLNKKDRAMRSRANAHDGAVMPVKKGQYYLVNADAGSPEFVEAYWLPIKR